MLENVRVGGSVKNAPAAKAGLDSAVVPDILRGILMRIGGKDKVVRCLTWLLTVALPPLAVLAAGPGLDSAGKGAEVRGHWAYRPPGRATLPAGVQGVDYLVRRRWKERGLSGAPAADRRTLVRRLYFDLVGLP